MQIELKFTASSQAEAEKLSQLFAIMVSGGVLESGPAKGPTIDVAKKALKKPALAKVPEYEEEPAEEPEIESQYDEGGEELYEAPKKSKASPAKKPAVEEAVDDGDVPQVKRGRGRPPKAKVEETEEPATDEDPEIEDEKPVAKTNGKKFSLDEVLKAFQSKKDKPSALALLKEYKAVNVRALDPGVYGDVMKKLAKIA